MLDHINRHMNAVPAGYDKPFWHYWMAYIAVPLIPALAIIVRAGTGQGARQFLSYVSDTYGGYLALALVIWLSFCPFFLTLEKRRRYLTQMAVALTGMVLLIALQTTLPGAS